MIRRFYLAVLMLVVALPAVAQDEVPLEERLGSGRKGRFTLEEAQVFALRAVEGQVLATDVERENAHMYYEYTIKVEDGSIYEVEINALTGKVFEIEIEYLTEDAVLPMSVIPEETVKTLAVDYILNETMGKRKPKVLSIIMDTYEREPAYNLTVKKSGRRYNILIHAQTGKIIEMEQAD